jgi:NAD(P)-dependent dehydrogenase (short-subunit alcohol dehydrogenase family)
VTPWASHWGEFIGISDEVLRIWISSIAFSQRRAEPAEIATLFAFLASDEARSVTGAVYTVDNGLTAS